MKMIGTMLIEHNLLTEKQLNEALEIQSKSKEPIQIGEILIELGYIKIETLLEYLDIQIRSHKE